MNDRILHIETNRLLLRIPKKDEANKVLDYFSRNTGHLKETNPPSPKGFFTHEYWEERLEKSIEEFRNDQSLRLFAFLKNDPNKVIASINYTNFSRGPFQACFLGYSICRDSEGKGLMTEALQNTNTFVFEELNFHRIMANYLPENIRSAKLLERLRFSIEGEAQKYLFINGKWRDHVLTSLINLDWEPKVEDQYFASNS